MARIAQIGSRIFVQKLDGPVQILDIETHALVGFRAICLDMPTNAEIIEALGTATVEIAEGRIQRWQEGDKRGEFHRVDHLAKAIKDITDVEDNAEDESQTAAVTFVC